MKSWCVYLHLFPNNKKYFGITCKKPNNRWENGNGYSITHQPVMYNAIQKYGWDNIQHIIIKEDLNEEEAKRMEQDLIAQYKTNCTRYGNDYGYNMTDGGEGALGHKMSNEGKRKARERLLGKTGTECCNSKPVVCDGVEYASLTEFKKKTGAHGAINAWLLGQKAMPKEWYDKGLHYKNQAMENIKCQESELKKTAYYNGEYYSSYASLAKELNVSPATITNWFNGKTIPPKEITERGIGQNENNLLQPKEQISGFKKELWYDGKLFPSQKSLADYLHVKPSTLSAWLLGKRPMPLEYSKKGLKSIK